MIGKNNFYNTGDVFQSEGDQTVNIGFTLEQLIKVISMSDLTKAKAIEEFQDFVFSVYGKPIDDILKSGLSEEEFWREIKTKATSHTSSIVSLKQLKNKDLDLLSLFYENLATKEYTKCTKNIDELFTNKKLNNDSFALKYFLDAEMEYSKENYELAFEQVQQSINLSYSEIYIIRALEIAVERLNRIDLVLAIMEKIFESKAETSISLFVRIQGVLLKLNKFEEVLKSSKDILSKIENSNDRFKDLIFQVKSNLIHGMIASPSLTEKDIVECRTRMKDLQILSKTLDPNNEDFYSKINHYLPANLERSIFEQAFLVLENATAYPFINENQHLISNDLFLNTNYLNPKTHLDKAIELTKERITFLEKKSSSSPIEISYFNIALLQMKFFKLKKLLVWKINHVSEKLLLDSRVQQQDFSDYTTTSDILNSIQKNVDLGIEKSKKSRRDITVFIIKYGDFLRRHVEDEIKSTHYYKVALNMIPKKVGKNHHTYEYLRTWSKTHS